MSPEMRGYEGEADQVLDVDPEGAMSLTAGDIVSQAWKAYERW